MDFSKYQHLERFGTTEVENIEFGECYVFPKLDGTNASLWWADGKIQAGSRKRHLTEEKDNAGFFEWAKKQSILVDFLKANPSLRLFGEWLVPHSLKTYNDDAWRRFYIFDVAKDTENGLEYLHYNEYSPLLNEANLDYIAPISIINNGSYEQFINQLPKNTFLIQDGKGAGEGIVIKNYDFKNKFGRNVFAKIVTSEFKERHAKVMGASNIQGTKIIEEIIAKKYVTLALCEKTKAKIEEEGVFNARSIPRLLNTVYYDVVKEDCWEFVKENKNPTINFKTLQFFVFKEVKNKMPNLF